MAVTEQHFQLLTSVEKKPARTARRGRPAWVLALSWLAALASAASIGGVAGALSGGFALLAIPGAWMVIEAHQLVADGPA